MILRRENINFKSAIEYGISPSPQGATYAHCDIIICNANKHQQSRIATSRSLIMLPN